MGEVMFVVIAVGAGTINLALGKPATQSSTFLYHSINPVLVLIVMIGLSTTLKAFNETEKMAIARSLVSLFRVFVVFFIFKK
jgi:uncharacterized membrane protein